MAKAGIKSKKNKVATNKTHLPVGDGNFTITLEFEGEVCTNLEQWLEDIEEQIAGKGGAAQMRSIYASLTGKEPSPKSRKLKLLADLRTFLENVEAPKETGKTVVKRKAKAEVAEPEPAEVVAAEFDKATEAVVEAVAVAATISDVVSDIEEQDDVESVEVHNLEVKDDVVKADVKVNKKVEEVVVKVGPESIASADGEVVGQRTYYSKEYKLLAKGDEFLVVGEGSNGAIGQTFGSPTAAAKAITKTATAINGRKWWGMESTGSKGKQRGRKAWCLNRTKIAVGDIREPLVAISGETDDVPWELEPVEGGWRVAWTRGGEESEAIVDDLKAAAKAITGDKENPYKFFDLNPSFPLYEVDPWMLVCALTGEEDPAIIAQKFLDYMREHAEAYSESVQPWQDFADSVNRQAFRTQIMEQVALIVQESKAA